MAILLVVVLFLLLSKDKSTPASSNSNDNKEVLDSNLEIIELYGVTIESLVSDYIEQNNKLPNLEDILVYVNVENHTVSCETMELYDSGKIYLAECIIDDSTKTYTYGTKEETTPKESLTIYKVETDEYSYYSFRNVDNASVVATVPCQEESCTGKRIFDTYVVVLEKETIYIYDYENGKYLDFHVSYDYYDDCLSEDSILYAILYTINDKQYLYSLSASKTFQNIEGNLDASAYVSYYGYVAYYTDNITNFVNLKTGKVDYSITDFRYVLVDTKNGNRYLLAKNKIYDMKGNVLFAEENEIEIAYISNGTFMIVSNGVCKRYNSNYKLVHTSKSYTEIFDVQEDYMVVLDGTNLRLLDLDENILATFITDWSDDTYYYHSGLSGYYTENGKNGIYLVIAGGNVSKTEVAQNNPDLDEQDLDFYELGYEYYYIPSTKEVGKIATYIGDYAKPVLYLYPILPTFINVTFKYPENLTTTYPKYIDGWHVLANPNGDLYGADGKYYYALYWEEQGNHVVDFTEGFYVTKENAIDFLEEKLTIIGLNDKERNEFIMYWLPILEKNGQSLVYFELTDERNSYSPINIQPTPNSLLRVAIHVKKVDHYTPIREQKLSTFERVGFVAVEWGGVVY